MTILMALLLLLFLLCLQDDLICLPAKLAASLGGIGPLVLCTKVTNQISLIDPATLRWVLTPISQSHSSAQPESLVVVLAWPCFMALGVCCFNSTDVPALFRCSTVHSSTLRNNLLCMRCLMLTVLFMFNNSINVALLLLLLQNGAHGE